MNSTSQLKIISPNHPLHVPAEAVEAFSKQDPLFCEFLVTSGRVIIDNSARQALETYKNARSHGAH